VRPSCGFDQRRINLNVASDVRSTDRPVSALIAKGAVRSPSLQSLIQHLDQSDVFL
jgi:hypothetical protein